MPNKMERFTQPARRVLSFAQEEAVRLQHSTIGAEKNWNPFFAGE